MIDETSDLSECDSSSGDSLIVDGLVCSPLAIVPNEFTHDVLDDQTSLQSASQTCHATMRASTLEV